MHLWEHYQTITARLRRVIDRQAVPISFADLHGWISLTKTIISVKEIEMLFEMDDAYCQEINLELKDYAEREKDRQEKSGRSR